MAENVLPKHVAIVMDGNGRWAQKRMLPRVAGHHQGVEALRKVIGFCVEQQIPHLTLFAFSRENWQRPPYEVKAVMTLLNKVLQDELKEIHGNNMRLHIVGDVAGLAPKLQMAIRHAEDLTKANSGLNLNIAINYSGKWDITTAMQHIATDLEAGTITTSAINQDLVERYLSLADIPPPDLFIRSSGEQRISNFLLWQLAYTELYFTDTLWPDFDAQAMQAALQWYAARQRRFGKVLQETGSTSHA